MENNEEWWEDLFAQYVTMTTRHKLGTEHLKLSAIYALKLCWAHLVGGSFNVMSVFQFRKTVSGMV